MRPVVAAAALALAASACDRGFLDQQYAGLDALAQTQPVEIDGAPLTVPTGCAGVPNAVRCRRAMLLLSRLPRARSDARFGEPGQTARRCSIGAQPAQCVQWDEPGGRRANVRLVGRLDGDPAVLAECVSLDPIRTAVPAPCDAALRLGAP